MKLRNLGSLIAILLALPFQGNAQELQLVDYDGIDRIVSAYADVPHKIQDQPRSRGDGVLIAYHFEDPCGARPFVSVSYGPLPDAMVQSAKNDPEGQRRKFEQGCRGKEGNCSVALVRGQDWVALDWSSENPERARAGWFLVSNGLGAVFNSRACSKKTALENLEIYKSHFLPQLSEDK